MPAPSRDRLVRPVDISTLYPGAARRVHLMVDEPGLRWAGLSGTRSYLARAGVQRVIGHRRSFSRFPAAGRENRYPMTRGGAFARGRRSVLPHWYPRTPLRDITGIVRAIERRREELQVDETAEEAEAPENVTNQPSISGALFEHNEIGASTPLPTINMKNHQPSPTTQATKIMDHITLNEIWEDPDFLSPQKKLLNSIEKVREVWVEEQRKLERTPAAKKVERERKVRVLMSMR